MDRCGCGCLSDGAVVRMCSHTHSWEGQSDDHLPMAWGHHEKVFFCVKGTHAEAERHIVEMTGRRSVSACVCLWGGGEEYACACLPFVSWNTHARAHS